MRSFRELFSGYEYAYGQYRLTGETRERDGKAEGKAVTVSGATPDEAWQNHLTGKVGLGIIPLKANNTLSFMAIDIDKYNEVRDAKGVEFCRALAEKLPVPFVPCRSKSGGLHLYFFAEEPVVAGDVMPGPAQFITEIADYPDAERFPKQISRSNPLIDAGNWINLPYFGDTRKAINVETGQEMGLEEFLAYASARLFKMADLFKIKRPATRRAITRPAGMVIRPEAYERQDGRFGDGPPCLHTLYPMYVDDPTTGHRNDFLVNVGVYGYKRGQTPEAAVEEMRETNGTLADPLTEREMKESLYKNPAKYKSIQYGCEKLPIKEYCDRTTCMKRAYGIRGNKNLGVTIDNIQILRYETPIYLVTVEGHQVEFVGAEDLFSLIKFRAKVADTIGKAIGVDRQADFYALIAPLVNSAITENVEDPLERGNQLADILTTFIEQREAGGDANETAIASGAVIQQADGRYLMSLSSLLTFMRTNYREDMDKSRLQHLLTARFKMRAVDVAVPGKSRQIQGILIELNYD